MPVKAYITAQDIVDAIGEPTYMALFDDANTGDRATVDASTAVQSTIARAHAETVSWLPDIYATMPPEIPAGIVTGGDSIPVLFKDAELKWATVYAYRRHKEYVRTYSAQPGGSLVREVEALMERIATAAQRVAPTDSPPEPSPHNVGGGIKAPDPDNPPTRFTDFGDY